MARAYDNDLRRKYLEAHDRGEGSLEELAVRFGVSRAWGWKVSAARKRSGQIERVIGRLGRPSRVTVEHLAQLRGWVDAQPDLTLSELQRKLQQQGLRLSIGRLWQVLRKLDLRLKKSRYTPPSATPKPTASGVGSSSQRSVRSLRNA